MSDKLGLVAVLPENGAAGIPDVNETSPQTRWLIDQQVQRVIEEAHVGVTELLLNNRDQLDSLARALLQAETLDATDAYAAADVAMRTPELETTAVAAAVEAFPGACARPD